MKNKTTKVTGGCLCGRIRYATEVFLKNGSMCHCSICQRSSGQPAEAAIPIKAGTFDVTKGELKYYTASEYGQRGFCPECGSRINWQAANAEDDWLTNISIGTLDNASEAMISSHIFIDTQIPWYRVCDELPKFSENEINALMEFLKQERDPDGTST